MIINHNITALNTHRQMGTANNAQMKSMEKLSSGMRINSAADDAAGLSISEKMRGQIRGLEQAGRNAQDGISYIQTAEGALNEVSDILVRMKELAVQKANGTNSTEDTTNLQLEMTEITAEANKIISNTKFNGTEVFKNPIAIVVSDSDTDTFSVGVTQTALTLTDTASIETAINTINTARSTLGSQQNRLEHTINNLGTTSQNLTSAESRIRDVDYAKAA